MTFGKTSLLLCAILGASATVKADDAFKKAADRLASAVERARVAGLPFTLDELNRGRSKPTAEENAAELVNKIGAELDKQASGWADIATLEKLALDRNMVKVKAGLKPYQPALALTEEASARPRADFGRDWDFGWKTTFGEYSTMKQASRLLGIRAQVRAAAGDVSGALLDLGRIQKLAKLVSDERTLVGVIEGVSTAEVGEKAVERVAAIWVNDDGNLAELQKFLANPIELPSLVENSRGDFYQGVSSTRNLGDIKAQTFRQDLGKAFAKKWEAASIIRTGDPQTVVAQAILSRHIENWLAILPIMTSTEPPLKRIAAIDAIVVPSEHSVDPLAYVFELLHVSESAVQAPAALVDIEARRACNRALVSALRYKLSRGHLPMTIVDISFNETDPWTGEPLYIRVNGDKIRVYSLGPNGKDDGGRTWVELPEEPTLDFDISWARMNGDIVAAFPPLIPRTNPVHGKGPGR